MKTLALILLALGLSYTSPKAQVGVITHHRNGTTTTTTIQAPGIRVAPGVRIFPNRTTTVYSTPQVYSTQPVYSTQRTYSWRRHRYYRTENPYLAPQPYVYTAPNRGIENAREHGGRAHAYGLERHDRDRFARMNRER